MTGVQRDLVNQPWGRVLIGVGILYALAGDPNEGHCSGSALRWQMQWQVILSLPTIQWGHFLMFTIHYHETEESRHSNNQRLWRLISILDINPLIAHYRPWLNRVKWGYTDMAIKIQYGKILIHGLMDGHTQTLWCYLSVGSRGLLQESEWVERIQEKRPNHNNQLTCILNVTQYSSLKYFASLDRSHSLPYPWCFCLATRHLICDVW